MSQENSMFYLILSGGLLSVIKAILDQFFVLILSCISLKSKFHQDTILEV